MQIFKKTPNFDFMARRNLAMIFSLILVIGSIVTLGMRGLNFGLDFTGGTLIEVGYDRDVELPLVRSKLENAGFTDAVVQHFGKSSDVLIKLAPREVKVGEETLSDQVLKVLQTDESIKIDMRRQEYVGPQVGEELRDQGGIAMIFALGLILIYVMLRFEYRFALGSIIALAHDVIITLGFFSLFQWEFDLTVLAAVLAVIGYSLNDTIVVFDRIRENFRVMRKGTSIEVINTSLNQTLSRTLMTSMTTLLVVVAMFFIGGELIHSFSTALIIGIGVGTYSSIYVASTSALALKVSREHLMPVVKEGEDQQNQEV